MKKRLNSSKSVFVELPGWSHFNIKFGLKIDLNEIIELMKLSNNAKLFFCKQRNVDTQFLDYWHLCIEVPQLKGTKTSKIYFI